MAGCQRTGPVRIGHHSFVSTSCTLLAINRNAFLHLVKTSPAFGASLLAGLAERAKDMAVRNK